MKKMVITPNFLHLQHLEELSEYVRFGLWWIFLGVASSIGLGKNMFYSVKDILYQFLISGLSFLIVCCVHRLPGKKR